MKLNYNISILLSFFSILGGAGLNAMDSGLSRYALEYQAALAGQEWYDGVYVPSVEEVEGHIYDRELTQIKIRLPIDLKRIFDEYHQSGKPISLAVACGDRELPWRANIAALHNDSSRPNSESDWNSFGHMLPLNYDANSENFISIDPLLGIPSTILEGSAHNSNLIGRGAGHLVMDAMKLEHWRQLAKFFEINNIKIHQIIFTTGMGSPTSSLEFSPEFFATQLSMLEAKGKIVDPYFLNGNNADKCFSSLRRMFSPYAENQEWWLQSARYGDEIQLNDIFEKTGRFVYNGNNFSTNSLHFINLVLQLSQGIDVSETLAALIEDKFSHYSADFKRLIYNLSQYYLSIFDINVFNDELNYHTVYLLDSMQKQMKALIPFYKEYYAAHGLHTQFLTSSQQAETMNNLGIEAQIWEPGNYPYGEREHIALVLTKMDPKPF